MKKTKYDIICDIIIILLTIMVIIVGYFSIPTTSAQSKSDWVEIQSVEIPEGLEIFSGITRNGNPKYWFIIEDIKVFISPTNKEHYINNTCTILLVEWYNKSKNTYKYTTRQKKETKQSKRINLEKI